MNQTMHHRTNRSHPMNTKPTRIANPEIELFLLDAEAGCFRHESFLRWLRRQGVPDEIVLRLARLWRATKRVGRRVVRIGRIVLKKICEFLAAHPMLALGAAIGAAISLLIWKLPIVGKVLGPIATLVGVWSGGTLGHSLDRTSRGRPADPFTCALETAGIFFRFFLDLCGAVWNGLQPAPATP